MYRGAVLVEFTFTWYQYAVVYRYPVVPSTGTVLALVFEYIRMLLVPVLLYSTSYRYYYCRTTRSTAVQKQNSTRVQYSEYMYGTGDTLKP